jgi:hypothetical protein
MLVGTTTLALAVLELLYLDQLMVVAAAERRQQYLTPSQATAVQVVVELAALETHHLMEVLALQTLVVVVVELVDKTKETVAMAVQELLLLDTHVLKSVDNRSITF